MGDFWKTSAGVAWGLRCAWVCAALAVTGPNVAQAGAWSGSTSATASSASPGSSAAGALDGDRFSADPAKAWLGGSTVTNWWWEVRFDPPRRVGAILQIIGDHPFVLKNAPREYVWQSTSDGVRWRDLRSTQTRSETRTFRLHRLPGARQVSGMRLLVSAAHGARPTLREVEFPADPAVALAFPEWILVVNTTHQPDLPGTGQEFIPLARSTPGWEHLQAQQVWLADFKEEFVRAEPRPLCAFLSGNFKDWCEVDREPWRGTQEVMRRRNLPLWGSCGGAQGMAILAENGADRPWDCPHCRDPRTPKTPIYTHVGHTGVRPCGDYSACVFERGLTRVKQVGSDSVFNGLATEFSVMESHCGQIEWPPRGWHLVATAGEGARTKMQCLRMNGRPIYAAQFHIEMEGTPENSRRIMGNFLSLARQWGGWNPNGKLKEQ